MDEKKLKGFVSIFENKSMTKAAEKIYTTPPALMRQLDALENELNTQLFKRSPSGCTPTETGKLLYNRIVPVLNEMNLIKDQIQMLNKENNRIRICTTITASLPLIDLYCEKLLQVYPSLDIQYVPSLPEKWIDLIRSGKADCALLSDSFIESITSNNLAYGYIGNRGIIAIMAAKHPLAAVKHLTVSDIKGEKLFIDYATYCITKDELDRNQVDVQILQGEMSPSDIYNICRKNGIRITSSPYGEQFSSLISIPIDLPSMPCGWVTPQKQSDMMKELIRISREQNDLI